MPRHCTRADDERDLKMLALWSRGFSQTEIAGFFGLTQPRVTNILSRIRRRDLEQSGECETQVLRGYPK